MNLANRRFYFYTSIREYITVSRSKLYIVRSLLAFLLAYILFLPGIAHTQPATIQRPKLVVGIIVDQMRWDYLYRYYDRYSAYGAFKRILGRGFSCENTTIPYIHTVTACGHASIYTGTIPAIHGITGNEWWDYKIKDYRYCTTDDSIKTVGAGTAEAGAMSPSHMLVTTICDELKLATNFKSKVIGIALKDRGGILPAGHTADAAYWYDSKTGNWISSTWYMNNLPGWVSAFNAKKWPDSLYMKNWATLYPLDTYTQSASDEQYYESKIFGPGFPYFLGRFAGKNYNPILATPHGNTLTTEFAKAVISNESLGEDDIADFLAISYSSPDYVGHSFGPNSVEQEDIFLRLDKELGEFFDYLDMKVGKDQYLLFLSSDHGVSHVPGFLNVQKIPAGHNNQQALFESLNTKLEEKTKVRNLVSTILNNQVVLNRSLIESSKLNRKEIKEWIVEYCLQQPGIVNALDLETIMQAPVTTTIREMVINGYYPARGGEIQLIYQPQQINGFEKGGTTHGGWHPYDAHVPLVWYGWNITPGKLNREVYITDIAPTLAALLRIQMPSGCIGKVIGEVIK